MQGQYKETTKTLDLYVVQTSAPPVLGLKACTDMGLIKVIPSVDKDKPTNILEEFKDVFSHLGLFEGENHIHMDPNYQHFGTCDARGGYWTIKLEEKNAMLRTFNTAFDRYKFLCLPFGLIYSQDVFQQKSDHAYEGLDGVEPNC